MVGIKVYNQWLDTDQGSGFSYTQNSPLFISGEMDKITAPYSSDIKIPLTRRNKTILDYPDELDNHNRLMVDMECELYINGFFLNSGELTVTNVSNGTITVKIVINPYQLLRDTQLGGLDLDTYSFDTVEDIVAHALDTATNPLDYNHAFFPVYNPGFIEGTEVTDDYLFKYFQNPWDYLAQTFAEGETSIRAVTPFIRLDYLIEKVITRLGFVVDNQWQTTDELKQIYLYNNKSLVKGATWGTTINLKQHVPDALATDLLKWYTKRFCLVNEIDFITRTWTIRPVNDILDRAEVDDWTDKAIEDYSLAADNYTPSQVGDAQEDYIEVEAATEVDRYDQITTTYSDVDIFWVRARGSYFFRNAIHPLIFTVSEYKRELRKVRVEVNGNDEFLSEMTALQSKWIELLGAGLFDQFQEGRWPGYVDGLTQGENPGLRVMIYRGLMPSRMMPGYDYPLATNNNYDTFEQEIESAEWSLTWDGEKGIYEKLWKNWLFFLTRRKIVKRKLLLNISDLVNFQWEKKIRIGNMLYLCNEMKVNFTASPDNKVEVEAELSTLILS